MVSERCWTAKYFDGRRPAPLWVRLRLDEGALCLHPGGQRLRLEALPAQLECLAGRPRLLLLDGASLEIEAEHADAFTQAWQAGLAPPGRVQRCIALWRGAVAALLLLIASLLWLDQWGLPRLAEQLAQRLSRQTEDRLGQWVMSQLQKDLLKTPADGEPRWRSWRAEQLQLLQGREPELMLRLSLYQPNPRKLMNAFALPGGHIVVLQPLFEALSEDELLAVLAHEVGHVKHRHGLQGLARSVGLGVVAALTVSDYSSVAASFAVGLRGLSYSRDAEAEADAYAHALLRRMGKSPALLGQALRHLEALHAGGTSPSWLSSHPATEARVQAAEQAARQ